ncbi:hypothetical protein HanPI659440_Chr17g0665781 [Helianthus annuus]|nr:hypothetical protein HanPI659440_Chr17g0665781 [Helianthus annuus]
MTSRPGSSDNQASKSLVIICSRGHSGTSISLQRNRKKIHCKKVQCPTFINECGSLKITYEMGFESAFGDIRDLNSAIV